MSIKVMSAVWEIESIDSSECLVLIALADHADDQGRCYPSISRLSARTKLSDRGVQKVIARLIEKGFVTVSANAGQGGANLYTVTATPEPKAPAVETSSEGRDVAPQLRWRVYKRDGYACRYCGYQGHDDGHDLTVDHIVPLSKGGSNGESNLNTACVSCNSSKKNKGLDAWLEQRVNNVHPEQGSPRTEFTTPPNHVRQTPEPRSPKPSRTIIEPSVLDNASAKPADILGEVASAKASRSFIAFRQKIRKPLTETAARRLSASLTEIANQGGDPDDALGMAEERGWQAIKPEWYFKETRNEQHARPSSRRQHPGQDQQLSGLAGAAMRSRLARQQGYEG